MTDPQSQPSAPMLHFLCGKIGAGKSTLAAALASQPGALRISEDDWLAALYPGEIHGLDDYVRCAGRLRAVVAPHVRALLDAGLTVVLDFPANTRRSRAWLRELAAASGRAHRLHFLDVPDEVCKARLRARNESGLHPYMTSEEQYDAITSYFAAPEDDEGFVVQRHAWTA